MFTWEPENAGSTSPGSRHAATTEEYCRAIGRCSVPAPSMARSLSSATTTDRLHVNRPTGVRYAGSTVCTTKPSCRQRNTRNHSSRRSLPSGCTLEEGTVDAEKTMKPGHVALAIADDVLRPSRSSTPAQHRASNCVLRRRSAADRTCRHK